MTVRQGVERLKQAWMVLAGHRPAEVRFDNRDWNIALRIKSERSEWFRRNHPGDDDLADEVDRLLYDAIEEYANYERYRTPDPSIPF
jgi:hypothetical protein